VPGIECGHERAAHDCLASGGADHVEHAARKARANALAGEFGWNLGVGEDEIAIVVDAVISGRDRLAAVDRQLEPVTLGVFDYFAWQDAPLS